MSNFLENNEIKVCELCNQNIITHPRCTLCGVLLGKKHFFGQIYKKKFEFGINLNSSNPYEKSIKNIISNVIFNKNGIENKLCFNCKNYISMRPTKVAYPSNLKKAVLGKNK